MPEYLSPAVYVEEIPSGNKPIEGIGTSTAGFVGHAVKGPVGEAVPITNFAEYLKHFGGYFANGFLSFAVKAFFDEGGRNCYVVRTVHYGAPDPNGVSVPAAVASNHTFNATGDPQVGALLVRAQSVGTWGNDITIVIEYPTADTFLLRVEFKGQEVETFESLSMDNTQPNYAEAVVNESKDQSLYISVEDIIPPASNLSIADRRPEITAAGVHQPLANGDDGLTALTSGDYIGDAANGNGLHAFDQIEDVNIVAVPDALDRDVHIAGMAYCERRADCFYIADSQQAPANANDVLAFKAAQGSYAGGNAISSKYGALYTPWIHVFDPRTGGRIAIPPSAAIAGRYADIDGKRGVHKIAAGTTDGRLRSALGLNVEFSQIDQQKLNPKGINVLRIFNGVGNVIWGARTVSNDPEWRYINVRRLFLFLRGSILDGTGWIVFEPNDRTLWKSIERNVSAFLKLQWLAGALVGATTEEAFYVRCNEETNPQESIDLGRVITEIGVAPSKPAEFVVFRISQFAGGADAS